MKNVSIFKKIKLFSFYKKIIKRSRVELRTKFNIRVDKAYRLYTVINIPEELVGEAYSLKTSDINRISENYIRKYSKELGIYLDSRNLKELHDFYNIKKVNKYSYLIVFGFSLFKSQHYYNTIYYGLIPLVLLSSLIFFIL